MQFHIVSDNGKYFYRPIGNCISGVMLDNIIVEDIDITIEDILIGRPSVFVGILKNHILCVVSKYQENRIEVSGKIKVRDLGKKIDNVN